MPRRIARSDWWYRGRIVVVVEQYDSGPPRVTVKVGRDKVDPASRERAAWWLGEFLLGTSHDERYETLWR